MPLRLAVAAIVVAVSVVAAGATPGDAEGGGYVAAPPVIVLADGGGQANPVHVEFARPADDPLPLPDGVGPITPVPLPREGSVAQRTAELTETLERLARETDGQVVFWLQGTRLLVHLPPNAPYEVNAHMTGVAGAAGGATTGANPRTWLLTSNRADPDDRLAANHGWPVVETMPGVDVGAVSSIQPAHCMGWQAFERMVAAGRAMFVAAGNEAPRATGFPQGVAGTHLVGQLSPTTGAPSLLNSPTNTFTTSEVLPETLPTHDSTDAYVPRAGTSFTAPKAAGRATLLITHARRLLQSVAHQTDLGVYALAASQVVAPPDGPLADGDLTGPELQAVMRAVAVTPLADVPHHYWRDGFGVLTDDAIAHAMRILEGVEPMPQRPEEEDHALFEASRVVSCPLDRFP